MGDLISATDASLYASWWHGGQWTRLYALASSGAPVLHSGACQACEGVECAREVADAWRVPESAHPENQAELEDLAAWVHCWVDARAHTCT